MNNFVAHIGIRVSRCLAASTTRRHTAAGVPHGVHCQYLPGDLADLYVALLARMQIRAREKESRHDRKTVCQSVRQGARLNLRRFKRSPTFGVAGGRKVGAWRTGYVVPSLSSSKETRKRERDGGNKRERDLSIGARWK